MLAVLADIVQVAVVAVIEVTGDLLFDALSVQSFESVVTDGADVGNFTLFAVVDIALDGFWDACSIVNDESSGACLTNVSGHTFQTVANIALWGDDFGTGLAVGGNLESRNALLTDSVI